MQQIYNSAVARTVGPGSIKLTPLAGTIQLSGDEPRIYVWEDGKVVAKESQSVSGFPRFAADRSEWPWCALDVTNEDLVCQDCGAPWKGAIPQ